jgi:hypothetical protein
MPKSAFSLAALAAVSLALMACAGQNVAPVDFNRPFEPWTGPAPVFNRNLAIANPPHPHARYENYEDEPTRFTYRPRNVVPDETDDGTGAEDQAYDFSADDMGGGEE